MAATCKNHICIYLNEGRDVTTAEQMRCARLSHGGVESVRVAALQSLNETEELQKIPAISKLNNFQHTSGSLRVWRACDISQEKNIAVDKVASQCHFTNCISCKTQFRGTTK